MAPTAIEKLISERDAVSDTISRIEAKVADHPTNPLQAVTVSSLIEELAEVKADLKNVHTRIRATVPDAADMLIYKKAYFDLADLVDSLYSSLHGIKANFPVVIPASTGPTQHSSSMRLPKLQLPTFDGNLLEWTGFRDLFDSAIHQITGMSKWEKLSFLRTLVKGEAAQQIQNMILSDSNYDLAWQQLHDRYQNDRELLFAVLRKFYEQPSAQVSSSAIRSLIDISRECLRSLEILNMKADKSSEAMMLFVIITKLDSVTRELWEQSLKGTAIPPLSEIFDFLEQRARALAAGSVSRTRASQDHNKRSYSHHGQSSENYQITCIVCNDSYHPLYKCSKFLSFTLDERQEAARRHNRCYNCLHEGHSSNKCQSSGRCRTCKGRHNSLLHHSSEPGQQSASPPVQSSQQPPPLTQQTALGLHSREDEMMLNQTMLATATIMVMGRGGQRYTCRALLDGGSTASFITEACLKRLGLPRMKSSVEVFGLAAAAVGTSRGITTVSFGPYFQSTEKYVVQALVLPKVTSHLPLHSCDTSSWTHLGGLTLADPEFNKPAPIDILLGSDVFWNLLKGGHKSAAPGLPLAIESSLGWLVVGQVDYHTQNANVHVADVSLDKQIQAFWELEEVPSQRILTAEETKVETFFEGHHSRDETGRFIVALPLKDPKPVLGSSRDTALRRLQQLERRLSKNPSHQQQYIQFMDEYEHLGHMSLVPELEVKLPNNPTYFIPHHFVLKEDSTTTKFRVVFDASAKTTSGVSLNDSMMIGPNLQDTLVDIVMRFRIHKVAVTADIAKMYRQIKVTKTDSDLQRILWRKSPLDQIKEYKLETVTYGTASAPYLAVKVLQQLAKYESSSLPLASVTALTDFYVDDLMSGAASVEDTIKLQSELIQLTNRGGLELRKWTSNSKEVLESLPPDLRESNTHLDIDSNPSVKALGIRWNTKEDRFEFQCHYSDAPVPSKLCTKRLILSEMSKLFDPLGWLSPIIITAKIFIQSLWKIKVDWDETLPEPIQQYWHQYKIDLKEIDKICIPRCILPHVPVRIDLVGFCDASEKAYAGVVYICAYYEDGCDISLVTSKTRVAPAKKVSLPRLELCGALLLAELMESVKIGLKLQINNIRAWSDSTIVLAWIHSHPSKWKNFVANRVTKIQNIIPSSGWNHVAGTDNPADCASRGLTPVELQQLPLWWNGPDWLTSLDFESTTANVFPLKTEETELIEEEERRMAFVATARVNFDPSLLTRYSSLSKLIRVTSWILRWRNNVKSEKFLRITGPLTPKELQQSENKWIQIVQHNEFEEEISLLSNKKELPSKSRLLCLNPFVDSFGLLRVGGRLRNSRIPQDQKTPILLPRHSLFTELLIVNKHKEHLHAGPNLLLAILQQKYWIIRARDAVRFITRRCVICTKNTAKTQQQFMGDLPTFRVTPCRAFQRCGVDYAGPFIIKSDLTRSKVSLKAYLSLFVCFSTRAFHLEVVSSLSTDSFLAAFRRFVSRRGLPSHIHSDCGTNFVGANRELKELHKLVQSAHHQIASALSREGISWHFNPPGAPHFGGLWEAGVKSVKFHLNRIVGSSRLTFEELTTTMTQIEACLNSRPLTPFSTDPADLTTLTSGHFLIGEPLVSVPEPDLSALPQNRLSRFQLIQSFQQQFWKRWSREFLTRLQQRPKWLNHRKDLRINDLVLIKDDNLPPLKWKPGRVINLHPGSDDVVRVVTLRTPDGELKRPIHKLCLLPIDNVLTPDPESV